MKSRLKRRARIFLKGLRTWIRGYPLRYVRRRHDDLTDRPLPYGHLWAEVSTPIPNKGTPDVRANRLANLQLAIDHLHGLIVYPGKILAFWHHVPAPIERNGFRRGPVFVRGRVKIDVGGGLCLVATNLFNALLYGGCEILERHGHSIDPYGDDRFFTLGEDAAVAYGYKDLIARNVYETPLYLAIQLDRAQNRVQTQLWGKRPCTLEIQVKSTVLDEILPDHAGGISGWHVRTQRTIAPDPSKAILPLPPKLKPKFTYETLYQPCQSS